MPTIEDELRRVLDGYAAQEAPHVDRGTEVARRIAHHRRVRLAGTAIAAAVLVLAGAGRYAVSQRSTPAHLPVPAASATTSPLDAKPGHLPEYYDGGKLAASATLISPDQTSTSFTFTPTSWNFELGLNCAVAAPAWAFVRVNNKWATAQECSPTPGIGGGIAGARLDPDWGWRRLGVELGKPVTISLSLGTQAGAPLPTPLPGMTAAGVYVAVPWDTYPFPPRPSAPEKFTDMGPTLPNPLATVMDASPAAELVLPRKIDTNVEMLAPGTVDVYLDGVLVCSGASYGWFSGADCGEQSVGTGRLSSFHSGQKVTLTVVTAHFTASGAWRVEVHGD